MQQVPAQESKLITIVSREMRHGNLSQEYIASQLALCASQLNRRVKACTGTSVSAFIMRLRIERAEYLLSLSPKYSISEVAAICGFGLRSRTQQETERLQKAREDGLVTYVAMVVDTFRQPASMEGKTLTSPPAMSI